MKRDYIYILIIAAITVIAFLFYNRSRKLQRSNQGKDTIISEKNAEIKYHINDKGLVVSEKDAAVASFQDIAKSYPEVVKQLKEDFDIKMKNMRAYIKSEFVAQGQGKASVTNTYYIDSAGNKIEYRDIKFDDGYLRFSSMVFDSLNFGESVYSYSDTITTVLSRKKKWLLGKESFFASSMLQNPNAKVVGATNILVDSYRDKRFCIYTGVGYDPFNNRPVINVGIGFALVKF